MIGSSKVVDLTASDSESSDGEVLSLHERILRLKTNATSNENPERMSPLKFFESSTVINRKYPLDKDDSDSELPSVSTLLNNNLHKIQSLSSKEAKKEDSDLLCVTSELYSQKSSENHSVYKNESSIKSSPSPKRPKTTKSKQDVENQKQKEKQEKVMLREQKKQEKELAKALKASEKEVQKSKKPDECLKGMRVILDQTIIFENESEDIFSALDGADLKYNVEENPTPLSVIWCRTEVDITVENNQIVKLEKEESENALVLVIKNENFIRMVFASNQKQKGKSEDHTSLIDHICNIKSMFPEMEVTCVIIGLHKYQKSLKENNLCDLELKKISKNVSKTAIEEATTEVQVQAVVTFYYLENMKQFGDLLVRFSKALAQAPQRREKHEQRSLAFSWYADADSKCPVKIGKDGDGLVKLWQQQIRQFNNVGPDMAEAIISHYPTLQSLIQAYNRCSSTEEAEKLLQDIVVRRNYGPLGTQRRIGPELSYKIYLFYTSTDGNKILKR